MSALEWSLNVARRSPGGCNEIACSRLVHDPCREGAIGAIGILAALAAVAVLALASAGCAKPAAKPAAKSVEERSEPAPEVTSEAAKTRELEDKADGYQDRYQEIQESDMTAEEKAQAAGELVDEQQRTVREAEDGTAGGDDSQR